MALRNKWTRFLFLLFFCTCTNSLSIDNASNLRQKPIKRVAVIGAGIAGLSLAHALANSRNDPAGDIEVSIFDSRKSLDFTAGSGVQLNGGMAVLGKINPDIQKAAIDAAVPIGSIQSKNKSWFRDAADTLWDLSIENIIRNKGGQTAEELIVDGNVMWYGIMRGALQEALSKSLPKDESVSANFGKTLTGIRSGKGGAICEFNDGSVSGPFDLVVGCDGIKSAVKEYIQEKKISDDPSKREGGAAAALYSGIRIAFAVQDGESLSVEKETIKQVFADGAYVFSGTFGNGPNCPPCLCSFIISLDDDYNGPFKRKESQGVPAINESSDWAQDIFKTKAETRNQMVSQLERSNVPDENMSSMIENSDRFFELGVYFHNPFSFAGWSREIPSSDGSFAVLCGDSAHAMPPFLGQGANQAIQDSYVLAQKIHFFNNKLQGAGSPQNEKAEPKSWKSLLREYENLRFPPTASITAKAAILGYLETGGRDGFYSKFRDVFFTILHAAGVPVRVLLGAATPKV